MKHNTISVTVHGKVVLFGEHIVFYGSSALGMPISHTLSAIFKKSAQHEKLVLSSKEVLDDRFVTHIFSTCTDSALEIPNGTIEIHSNIPVGSGYGSSAALCVAIAKIILLYNQKSLMYNDIWYLAHTLEQFFHNPASGIDTAICTYGQAILLQPMQRKSSILPAFAVHPIKIPYPVVTAVVKRKISARELISYVAKKFVKKSLLQSIQSISQQALDILLQKDNDERFSLFIQKVQALQEKLTQLGLATSAMQYAMEEAIRSGAGATKISGAGGGGAFVCFCEDIAIAQYVQKKLQVLNNVNQVNIQSIE